MVLGVGIPNMWALCINPTYVIIFAIAPLVYVKEQEALVLRGGSLDHQMVVMV